MQWSFKILRNLTVLFLMITLVKIKVKRCKIRTLCIISRQFSKFLWHGDHVVFFTETCSIRQWNIVAWSLLIKWFDDRREYFMDFILLRMQLHTSLINFLLRWRWKQRVLNERWIFVPDYTTSHPKRLWFPYSLLWDRKYFIYIQW
jgi:hypothetical protein